MNSIVTLLPGLHALYDQYEAFIIDQWGVLHDGTKPYDGVVEALEALRERAVPVAILTNSSKSEAANRERLARLGIAEDLYGPLISTADLLKVGVLADAPRPPKVYLLASDIDARLFGDSSIQAVENLEEAECIVLLTLDDETAEFPERAGWITTATRRGLVLHTPSADGQSVVPGGNVIPGFRRLIKHYHALGGRVHLHGKPTAAGYIACCARLGLESGRRVAAIGDQFDTDVIGALQNGCAPILVGTGAAERERSQMSSIKWADHLTLRCRDAHVPQLRVLASLRW